MTARTISKTVIVTVDEADAHLLRSGYYQVSKKSALGVYRKHPDGSCISLAHDVLGVKFGTHVDYLDGDDFNCVRSNLRVRHVRGWTFAHGKYQVMRAGKYIGLFDTPDEAHAAYLGAALDV